jgi:hypothetical protein
MASRRTYRRRGQFRRPAAAILIVAATLLPGISAPVHAANAVITEYSLDVSGIPIADFKFNGAIRNGHYSLAGRGKTAPLVELIVPFKGFTSSTGAVSGGEIRPAAYSLSYREDDDTIKSVALQFGRSGVDSIAIAPSKAVSAKAVPLKPGHKQGVIDPMSAALFPIPGGPLTGEKVCNRTLPVFEGRQRFDLDLTFKRREKLTSNAGPDHHPEIYVCAIRYAPIAGHKPDATATRFLTGTEGIEIWLSPVVSVGMLIPYRAVLPTPVGVATLTLEKLKIVPAD